MGLHIVATVVLLLISFPFSEQRSYDFFVSETRTQKNLRITCYTCVNVSDNYECNRYAIDRPCSKGKNYCLTLHVMEILDEEGTILVNKRCASLEDCIGDSTGCVATYGEWKCVSCCDQSYCNEDVPMNETSAVFLRTESSGSSEFGTRIDVSMLSVFAIAFVSLNALINAFAGS